MSEIIHKQKINFLIERMAYQLAEEYIAHQSLEIVGMEKSGFILASEIYKHLQRIAPSIQVSLSDIKIDKNEPEFSPIQMSKNIEYFENKNIVLVDDVINSGRTLFYALKPFLHLKINQLQTLVLIERKYKKYPISADFVGVSLNTTFLEHIEVVVENEEIQSVRLN